MSCSKLNKYLDMFRGESHTIYKPAILDDAKFYKLDPVEVKAFMYPTEDDSLFGRVGAAHISNSTCAAKRSANNTQKKWKLEIPRVTP